MTVRDLKKQFFLGIVALMVSFISFTGATYAWFTMNTSVKADGMQISANMEGLNFEITNKYNTTAGSPVFVPGQTTVMVSYSGKASLVPTHPQNLRAYDGDLGKIADWYHAYSSEYDDAQIDLTGTKWDNVKYDLSGGYGYYWNDNADDTDSTFAMAVQFFVRLNPDTTGENVVLKDIKATNIKITDSTGSNELSKSVYLLVAGPKGTYQISTSDATNGESLLNTTLSESGVLIDKISPDGNHVSIVVFVFFDGKDKDCKSANFDPSDISISLDFVGTPGE